MTASQLIHILRVGQKKIDSFIDVLYPADPEVWKTYMNIPGELETFIRQKQRLERGPYLTPEVRFRHLEGVWTSVKYLGEVL